MSEALQVRSEQTGLMASAVSPGQIVETIKHVHALIREAMTEGIDGDYAVIPGTKKKTLLKPGAEKLLLAFGLAAVARAPQVTEISGNHREVIVETEIRNLRTGEIHAVGIGSCSTLERKYRYRPGPVEFTGAPVPREYWTDRKHDLLGGPGHVAAKNPDTGEWEIAIKGAEVENPDPADGWNTVLKMASKRSMIDGVLRATASSAMFTQDMEDAVPEGQQKRTTTSNGTTRPPIKQPKHAGNGDAHTMRGVVDEVSRKDGTGKNGPWTKFSVLMGGEWYGTFSTNLGAAAEMLVGKECAITWKSDGKYRTLVSIVGSGAADAQSERTAEDEQLDLMAAAKG